MQKLLISFVIVLLFLSILPSQAQEDSWALIMSKNTGYTTSIWRTRTYFPENEIKEHWDKGYYITNITYNKGKWALFMVQGSGFSDQMWRTRKVFPENEIEEFWDKGYYITKLTYGDGVWVLVMSKGGGNYAEIWRTRTYFPKDEIKENWDNGHYITNMIYGQGKWALVMAKGTGFTQQIWRTRSYFPETEIKEYWDKGYYITNLSYGDGKWALIMSKGCSYTSQMWRTRAEFPEKEIKEYWDKDFYITEFSKGPFTKSVEEVIDVPNDLPVITISEPTLSRGFKVVKATQIKVAGYAKDKDGISEITVNNIRANVDINGYFFAYITLHDGDNQITVKAVDNKFASSIKKFTLNKPQKLITTTVNEKRLALVIGNSNYQFGGKLLNPVNDAHAMKVALENLGFTVLEAVNCDQRKMKIMIDEFGDKLANYDMGLFFYAGHGVQVKGYNYLIPVDSKLENERDVEYDCVQAGRVLAKMESAGTKTNLVILDACRDNPFERSWTRGQSSKGLAFMNAPSGSLIAYATSPGNTASDGKGSNGLYTSAILDYIRQQNLQIEDMFKEVRKKVIKESGGKQTPWESTSLVKDFYFNK